MYNHNPFFVNSSIYVFIVAFLGHFTLTRVKLKLLKGYIHVSDPGQVVERMPLKMLYSIIVRDVSKKTKNRKYKQKYNLICSG